VDFVAAAKKRNVIVGLPRRMMAVGTFLTEMHERIGRYDRLCEEADVLLRRVEDLTFDVNDPGSAIDTFFNYRYDFSCESPEVEINPEDVLKEEVFQSDAQKECTICLNDFAVGEKVSALPCGHRFHPDCIACWVVGHPSCPVCRRSLCGRRETM
jgi:hypothetical protein